MTRLAKKSTERARYEKMTWIILREAKYLCIFLQRTHVTNSAERETDQKAVDIGVSCSSTDVRVSECRQQKLCDDDAGLVL